MQKFGILGQIWLNFGFKKVIFGYNTYLIDVVVVVVVVVEHIHTSWTKIKEIRLMVTSPFAIVQTE